MAEGWVLEIRRLREDVRPADGKRRTVGLYAIWINGTDTRLWGYVAEPGGPGDNKHMGNDLCLEAGVYRIQSHSTPHYATVDYANGMNIPRPAVELVDTGDRQAILFHPGVGFLSSIGCLNPSSNLLMPDQEIDFGDSRSHVIRLINNLRSFGGPDCFNGEPIPGVTVNIRDAVGTQMVAANG
jgi:hypothetical protein